MFYQCRQCRRTFAFNDSIRFCPYCGGELTEARENYSSEVSAEGEARLNEVIDSIWGEKARLRSLFISEVRSCITIFNHYAEIRIGTELPTPADTEFARQYDRFKGSESCEELLGQVRDYVVELERTIPAIPGDLYADVRAKVEIAADDVEGTAVDLYAFLERDCPRQKKAFFREQNFRIEQIFSRVQLKGLYRQVLAAFEKYERCVKENDLFAAFPVSASYGSLNDYRRRKDRESFVFCNEGDQTDKLTAEEATQEYEEISAYMKEQNAIPYGGFLDEDCDIHVDAFWRGLEALCRFIDHCMLVKCDTKFFCLQREEIRQIEDDIAFGRFEMTENALRGARKLKTRLDEKIGSLADR